MGKRMDSLVVRFGLFFGIFTVIMLILSGFAIYDSQNRSYKLEREQSSQQVAAYLEDFLRLEGDEFIWYQDYMMQHSATLLVPHAFNSSDIALSKKHFDSLFTKTYPGETLGRTISFDQLTEEVKAAFTIYKHEYYLNKFETARETFGLIYSEYIVPHSETLTVTYLLDAMRDERVVDGKKYIELCITVDHPVEANHQKEWEAWETGKKPDGYDTFDNEYGKTYAFYTPLFIGERKMGLIGAEVEIATVNKAILHNALKQIIRISIIMILCLAALLTLLYMRYISKLEHLQKSVRKYAQDKNASIATDIEGNASGKDEISLLAMQVASMILEMENYMRSLVNTTRQLQDTQQQAAFMSELATKDALTGIRNKAAYDKEVARLEWLIADGKAAFGIAMIDLNFLKRINDTYGHEMGNIAIKKLCHIVCAVFDHSPVFRIGGDEFAVILENDDYTKVDLLVDVFNTNLEGFASEPGLEPWERISAAIGIAIYDASIDEGVANVFRRADRAMYARKKEMKAIRDK